MTQIKRLSFTPIALLAVVLPTMAFAEPHWEVTEGVRAIAGAYGGLAVALHKCGSEPEKSLKGEIIRHAGKQPGMNLDEVSSLLDEVAARHIARRGGQKCMWKEANTLADLIDQLLVDLDRSIAKHAND